MTTLSGRISRLAATAGDASARARGECNRETLETHEMKSVAVRGTIPRIHRRQRRKRRCKPLLRSLRCLLFKSSGHSRRTPAVSDRRRQGRWRAEGSPVSSVPSSRAYLGTTTDFVGPDFPPGLNSFKPCASSLFVHRVIRQGRTCAVFTLRLSERSRFAWDTSIRYCKTSPFLTTPPLRLVIVELFCDIAWALCGCSGAHST